MRHKICYVTDEFLEEYKNNFKSKYLGLYLNGEKEKITKIFQENIKETDKEFIFKPLLNESTEGNASENIKILWKSLSHLTVSEAENEKIWVALLNTYYLDYHLDQIKDLKKDAIEGRTIFTRSNRRSLVMNNLSILWWIANYLVVDNDFSYVDYFTKGSYRGNALVYLSSNLVSCKNVVIGTLAAIETLEEDNKIIVNRYAFTNSNKILNQVGGVKILDFLSKEEIKEIIMNNLLDTDKIRLKN